MSRKRARIVVVALIALQLFSAVFFISDVARDYLEAPLTALQDFHLQLEFLASLCLLAAIGFELSYLKDLHRREAELRQRLSLAGSAIEDVVKTLFAEWKLSSAERDVGMLLVKGMNISEIAGLRGNADGTIKAHLNSIYRKSGARSRAEVLSMIVDAVMGRDAQAVSEGEDARLILLRT